MKGKLGRLLAALGGTTPAFSEEAALRQQVADLKDLATSLYLYANEYTWRQLTTEQKELWADCIDEARLKDQQETYGNNDFSPYERWWRE